MSKSPALERQTVINELRHPSDTWISRHLGFDPCPIEHRLTSVGVRDPLVECQCSKEVFAVDDFYSIPSGRKSKAVAATEPPTCKQPKWGPTSGAVISLSLPETNTSGLAIMKL